MAHVRLAPPPTRNAPGGARAARTELAPPARIAIAPRTAPALPARTAIAPRTAPALLARTAIAPRAAPLAVARIAPRVRALTTPLAHLLLLALLVMVACSDAGAETAPTPPSSAKVLKVPQGWEPQPAIATAAKDALGKATIEGIEAIGEPAIGCYAVWMTVNASGGARDVAEQLVRGLTAPPKVDKKKPKPPARKLEIKDVVKPVADDGVLSLSFESPPYQGRFRARLGKGKITAMACFSSQREPVTCETQCTTVLGAIP